ncbi:hypothetical protein BCR33DRAFT_328525 [Rhizoclosmatium globosum]|uniref:Uncharacterized protein n=1 Tax=Rhizoclosmatium globosum TaxID=329046 RepID=A0A1Y2C4X3_9FUNG|nr:hypothetical protein BCR33DRAFT_328525 [Rhizoclosmatium globosum]|eukprot:ORY41934.1 hypothetical protein BCR33DRAFT_328525 [Rhizoclosmatium globosum]
MVLAFDFFFLESTSTSKSSDKEKRPNLHTGLDPTSSADSRPSYIGTECFPGSTYWDNPCLGGCLPNDTCTFWKTGKPQWLSQPLTRSVKWKVQKTETDYDYTLGKDGVNMLPDNKRYHIFTQREAIECLKGRRLLISGDSMLRQLFIYTTYWFRGIQSPIESYFHVESHYTHRKDSDEIEIGPFMWPSREQDDEHGNLFHIAFVWSGTAFMKQSAVDLDVDVVVAGVNYWSDQVVEMGVVKDLYEFVDGG